MNTDNKKDAVPVSLVLRDGYLEVRGDCGGLRDKLRYYRKEIGREGYDRKVVTTHEDLFDESNDEQGELLVTMPGFTHKVLEYFRSNGIPWRFMDARTPMPAPNYARAFQGLRPYQVPLVGRLLKSGGGILAGATGCLAKGTPVRMADGSIKSVEDVKPGDRLLAFDDSTSCLTQTTVCEMIMTSPNHSPKPMLEVTLNGEKTCITYDHPFFGGDGFYPLYQLVWGALEAGQRAQLKLLCEQYGAPFDDKAVWCKHGCSNVPCFRLAWVLQDNAGWAYREGASNCGGELAGEPAWVYSGEPYRLQSCKQQGGEPGMVHDEVQCVVWGNPWQYQGVQASETGSADKRGENGDQKAVSGEDRWCASSAEFAYTREGQVAGPDNGGIRAGQKGVFCDVEKAGEWPRFEVKKAEPYYTIRTREAPYTYCIGRRNCYLTHNCGKTAVSAAVIRAYDRAELCSRGTPLCVFACPDRDINRKNWVEFHRWLPDRNIGLIMSGAKNVQSDDVVCCTIDSLDHIDPDSVGILIVDEMHTSASRTRSERIAMFQKARKWGVSATPTGRFDGADAVSEGLYGPVVATFSYQDGVKSGALVPITVLWLPAPPPVCGLSTYGKFKKRDAKIRHGSTINDDFAMAVAEIFNCTPKDTQILGVMQFIEQMQHVSKFCSGTGCVHAETNPAKLSSFPNVSAIKPSDRKRIYDAFRTGELTSMLSTMVWSTGVDFPDLSVVVNIGGGGSDIVAKQIPGRASRKSDGKDHAYIVDFVHKWDREDPEGRSGRPGPLLSNDFARRRAYKSLGFEQVSCNRISELPFVDQEKAVASRLASSILDPGTTLL